VKKAPSHMYACGQLEPWGDLPFYFTNPNFFIAYTLSFVFVSLKVGEKQDTKLGLREVHHPF
jgi:hypothetical protein